MKKAAWKRRFFHASVRLASASKYIGKRSCEIQGSYNLYFQSLLFPCAILILLSIAFFHLFTRVVPNRLDNVRHILAMLQCFP